MKYFYGVIIILLAALGGFGIGLNASFSYENETENASFTIELSEEQVPTQIETADGVIESIDAPTVESVDTGNIAKECPEGEECGQGRYIYAPTETPQAFKDYTLGGCWDTDVYFNEQCWDLGDLFWQNYAGRNLSTCGTGAAKGIWNCKEQNAGDDFVLITDATQLQQGDWVIFNNGTYGHVGMALGGYNNGYVALLGQNQGGGLCPGSTMGARTNIINISLKSFAGAFRPKSYIKPEPQPEPTPIPVTGCVNWHVLRGDTMSKIMLECEGTVVYGEPMNAYARTWYSLIIKPGQSVYEGWASPSGVGLYENDDIEHKVK